ncbi:MAG: T9SS type A sorting domain-containing protein [Flavobacteriales bacterium]|nr:T9SS type A sorting domain-containing protein [Flavobacteriales bacterium]
MGTGQFIRFVWLLMVLCMSSKPIHGQQWSIDFQGRDFFQLRDSLRHYYDSLATAGDSSAYHEGGPYSRFKRWDEFWSLRLKAGTNFRDYFNAEAVARADMQSRSAGNTDPWYEIGPKDKPTLGENSIGQGSQPGIGPIHFISFSDVDADKMLCGSNIGGLWYSDNEGQQWVNGGSDGGAWKRTGCKSAVFKVGDAFTWYAANSGYFFYSGAILRGTNYGATWEVIADQSDFPAGGVWTKVNKIVTVHNDPNVLYAATEHRLWRTTNVNDQDPTWSEVYIPVPPSITGNPDYGTNAGYTYSDVRNVYDFEVDPIHATNLYATVRFDGENSAQQKVQFWRLMRSQDGGGTWTEMPNQPLHPFYLASDGSMRNANLMTIEVTHANSNWLYVFYDLNDPNPPPPPQPPNQNVDELYKITDAAMGNWAPPLKADIHLTYGAGNGFGVDQIIGEDVYIENSTSLGRYSSYVNGGWTTYTSAGNYLQYHVDVEDFVGDPDEEDVVWMANHGGIHRSADGGATWEWRGSGLAVAQVYRMANSYSEPDRLITGLYHDASLLTQGMYGPAWEPQWWQLGGADGQKPLIDHDEGNWMYWSSQSSAWRKSDNYGSNWQSMSAWNCGCLEWETAGAMDNGVPNAIYLPGWSAGSGGCYSGSPCMSVNHPAEIKRSVDRGASWEVISNFLSPLGTGRKIVWRIYSSPYDANELLVHFPDGQRVFRTRMARSTATAVQGSWQEVYVPRTDRFIADIDFDPLDPDVLYFAYSSEVMDDPVPNGSGMLFKVRYEDAQNPMNATAQDLSALPGAGALPNTGVGSDAVVLERGSNGGMYIGTDLGVYYTNNEFLANGTGWQLLGGDLPHVSCRGLEISYKANRLRAGMEGRGVWEHDLWCPSEIDLVESGTYNVNAFREALNDISATALVPVGKDVSYRAGNEVHLLPGFHASSGSRFHAFIHPCDKAGNSFKSMLAGAPPAEGSIDFRSIGSAELEVYPNPNKGRFTLLLPDGTAAMASTILWNAQGKRFPIHPKGSGRTMSVTLDDDIPSGLYLMRVQLDDGAVLHTKIIIEP